MPNLSVDNHTRRSTVRLPLPVLAMVTLFLAPLACGLLPPNVLSPTQTATPTQVISGNGLAPTSAVSNGSTATIQPADVFTVQGTHESLEDITSTGSGGSSQTHQHMVAQFTLKSAPGGRLTGTAQVSWTDSYQIGGGNCKLSWTIGPLTWTPTLEGQYQKMSDGSLQVSFKATPDSSPSYTTSHLCIDNIAETAPWPGSGGVLVNGRFEFRQDFPATGDGVSGGSHLTTHIEQVPNP